MAKYRSHLPQLSQGMFVTDSGLETTLIFRDGIDLPEFASFVLLQSDSGRQRLRDYYRLYAEMARRYGMGLVLESPTWRANRDWAQKVGLPPDALPEINRQAIAMLVEIRDAYETEHTKIVISGNIGPRGDGYVPSAKMSAVAAQDYHAEQIRTFAQTDADMVSAFTINYVEEAIGVVNAAKAAGMPAVISFTLETDGKLPSGQSLKDAIEKTDAATQGHAAYYMINCVHPTHFANTFAADGEWGSRIRGLRPNASKKSHAELDASTELDDGVPVELGQETRDAKRMLKELRVIGGCCGTDERHVEEMCKALAGTV
ncbi:homocysteine S-methyltransferase [Noviherbaspirillum cavernae]|uniref:Homocysteine S-methyltransferase n=1 Tax=Noviherbaspirillum cavernae TaxID=2320862 RepID=A0A418X510_9BURK|nr:homocysteine S-methyltransferase family protein [Noviherbaspirillum cavernae]RJG07578.1 homocysteine S-methyltransferase [Noviherbaspirillum cavernae]